MKLRIVTPLSVVVDEEIDNLRAEDISGSFGILPGHAPFLTALAISIISWRTAQSEKFCAVRGGVLQMTGNNTIDVTTREAVIGTSLVSLDSDVLAQFESDADDERTDNAESVQLQLNVIRRMVSRLSCGADVGEFR